MSIIRDDGDERQTRVDCMIEGFRKAQSRRLAKTVTVNGGGQVVELQRDVPRPGGGRRVNDRTTDFTLA